MKNRTLLFAIAVLMGLFMSESIEAQILRNAFRNAGARQDARFAESVQRQNVAALNASFAALNSCGHVAAVQALNVHAVPVVQRLNVQEYTVPAVQAFTLPAVSAYSAPVVQAVAVPAYSQAYVAPVQALNVNKHVQNVQVQRERSNNCASFFSH